MGRKPELDKIKSAYKKKEEDCKLRRKELEILKNINDYILKLIKGVNFKTTSTDDDFQRSKSSSFFDDKTSIIQQNKVTVGASVSQQVNKKRMAKKLTNKINKNSIEKEKLIINKELDKLLEEIKENKKKQSMENIFDDSQKIKNINYYEINTGSQNIIAEMDTSTEISCNYKNQLIDDNLLSLLNQNYISSKSCSIIEIKNNKKLDLGNSKQIDQEIKKPKKMFKNTQKQIEHCNHQFSDNNQNDEISLIAEQHKERDDDMNSVSSYTNESTNNKDHQKQSNQYLPHYDNIYSDIDDLNSLIEILEKIIEK